MAWLARSSRRAAHSGKWYAEASSMPNPRTRHLLLHHVGAGRIFRQGCIVLVLVWNELRHVRLAMFHRQGRGRRRRCRARGAGGQGDRENGSAGQSDECLHELETFKLRVEKMGMSHGFLRSTDHLHCGSPPCPAFFCLRTNRQAVARRRTNKGFFNASFTEWLAHPACLLVVRRTVPMELSVLA